VRYLGGDALIGYPQSQIQIFYGKHYFNFWIHPRIQTQLARTPMQLGARSREGEPFSEGVDSMTGEVE